MPSASKGKGKGREARPSRSRNTTPNSSFSAPTAAPVSSYLDNDVSKLLVPVTAQYGEILDRMGGAGPIPDSKSLETLMEHLKTLSQLAEARSDACDAGIRELSQKRKEVVEEPEHDGDRPKMKREADDEEEESKAPKGGKLKKRKERGSSSREDRPLAHGAHELSRQDGAETKVEGGKLTLLTFTLTAVRPVAHRPAPFGFMALLCYSRRLIFNYFSCIAYI